MYIKIFSIVLLSFTPKEAAATVPVGGAWSASRAESRRVERQWEAPGRRSEQSTVQLSQQRQQCREP